MSSVPERSEIEEQHRWDLESLFADDEEWEAAYEDAEELVVDLERHEGRATEDAATLLEILETYEELMRTVANVASYARMRKDEDTTRDRYQALTARSQSLSSDASSAASFLEPALQQLEWEDVEAMMDEEPALAEYEHYFDDVLRMKEHTRSAEVENLLAELGEVTGAAGEVYNMLANADMEFPTVDDPEGEPQPITLNNFTTLQKKPDREFRQRVYEAFYDEWETVRNSVGAAYKNSVKTDVKMAQARNYDTAREAALDGPNVPVEVYDNLVETVNDNLDKLHRHAELKRDAIGADELEMWDLYVPVVQEESPEVEYDQACEFVVDAMAPLGEEYQNRVAEGLESRWVDVYETANKQSGAYSGGTYDSQPFILMNYQDDVESMYTLAHELGHSLHSEYTSESQPYVYSGYEIFVAEVASTVNEALLTHHLLETVDDEQLRRHVLNEYLERFRSTLYRQTMFAEFEHRTHEMDEAGEPLTPDRLDDLYRELKSTYYEPAAVDDRIGREWMRIPHFYRAFYVYQYATGISAAVALVDGILEDSDAPRASDDPGSAEQSSADSQAAKSFETAEPSRDDGSSEAASEPPRDDGGSREAGPAAERYVDFLESGSREYPIELLRGAGVDMASPEPIESALDTYGDYLTRLEELV